MPFQMYRCLRKKSHVKAILFDNSQRDLNLNKCLCHRFPGSFTNVFLLAAYQTTLTYSFIYFYSLHYNLNSTFVIGN